MSHVPLLPAAVSAARLCLCVIIQRPSRLTRISKTTHRLLNDSGLQGASGAMSCEIRSIPTALTHFDKGNV
jgi:hypothetical protein